MHLDWLRDNSKRAGSAGAVLLLLLYWLSPTPHSRSRSNCNWLNDQLPPPPLPRSRSAAAYAYWASDLDEDSSIQEIAAQELARRQTLHNASKTVALARGAKRNHRTSESPVTVYWPDVPQHFILLYGSKGEKTEAETCSVPCSLVSGRGDDAEGQQASHILMNWNVFRGSILGLSESKRNLRPWQKVALMSLEPNSFARWHLGRLKMFDMLTSFAHAEKIHEYYTRPLCSPRLDGRCVGIADIDSTMADTLWGRSREESPFPPLPLSLPDDGKLHLATFISNCAPKARARLIKDLVKEGVVFEHFGKCREDVFGGTPSPIVAEVEAALNTSRRVLQPGLVKEQILPLYPFTLALENTILSSYVTEKVHDALISPSVPLILGAPNLASEIQPESASEWPVFIDVTHYSPAELVSEMKRLMSAKDERRAYKSWLAHFGEEETTEPKIIRYFKRLQANDGSKWGSHYMRPICMMCEWYHEFYDFEGDVPLGFGDEK